MITNHIKLAWRNMVKYRFYTVINLFGLSVGIVFSLLIGAYIWQELQVNKEIKNADRQYILTSKWADPNMGPAITAVAPLAQQLKENYPQLVEDYYRWDGINTRVSKGNIYFEEHLQIIDHNLLSNCGFKTIYGSAKTAFTDPFSVVITEDIALKYFGKKEVLNEVIGLSNHIGETRNFTITCILKSIPQNAITQIDNHNVNAIFVSIDVLNHFGRTSFDNWSNNIIPSYLTLKEGVKPEQLKEPIAQLIKSHALKSTQENLTVTPVLLADFFLNHNNGLVKRTLYTLSFIGVFIVLMALVNFTNIAISQAGSRMREVGVRKVLGASQTALKIQFLTESLISVGIAFILALLAYPYLSPWFAQLLGKEMPKLNQFPLYFSISVIVSILFIAFLAGLYPAFILSSITTTKSLKGKLIPGKSGLIFRKSLVGFQFGMAFILLVATVIITKQTNYFFEENLGYNKEAIISATVPRDWSTEGVQKMEFIRNQFIKSPNIKDASLSYVIPNGNYGFQLPFYRNDKNPEQLTTAKGLVIDHHFLSTYNIPLKAGAFFDSTTAKKDEVVINEKALMALGWFNSQEAIGQTLLVPHEDSTEKVKIIGVVGDFHFGSKQETIAPQMFFSVKTTLQFRYLSFKLNGKNIAEDIRAVQSQWKELMPGTPFQYHFMDDVLTKIYAREIQLKKAVFTGSFLGFILIVLGVFGMVSMSIHKRTKEIGIRKVLGASTQSISLLFFKEFLITLFISTAFAAPIAYGLMHHWLNGYAYRIAISPHTFVWILGAIISLIFMLVKIQTLGISRLNPTKSLKTE